MGGVALPFRKRCHLPHNDQAESGLRCNTEAEVVLSRQVTQRMAHCATVGNSFFVARYPTKGATMVRRLPLVYDHHLHLPEEQENRLTPIVVESEAWSSCLAAEQNRSFTFRNLAGTFTVRCERKRHGWCWYAYNKRKGKLYKAYLGKTKELTLS